MLLERLGSLREQAGDRVGAGEAYAEAAELNRASNFGRPRNAALWKRALGFARLMRQWSVPTRIGSR